MAVPFAITHYTGFVVEGLGDDVYDFQNNSSL